MRERVRVFAWIFNPILEDFMVDHDGDPRRETSYIPLNRAAMPGSAKARIEYSSGLIN